jgi:tetratricopeptide (TPR) repeat protein
MGPLHAQGIDHYWRAFNDEQSVPFTLQRTLPRAFRAQLIAESHAPEYGVRDPRDLPHALRGDRWQAMCEALDAWDDLSRPRQCRLALLMHALCLYEPLQQFVRPDILQSDADNPDTAELAYWKAAGRYALDLPNRMSQYGNADMSGFEAILRHAPQAVPAALNATLKILVHKAKTGGALDELVVWQKRAEAALAYAVRRLDEFTGGLLTSRYYRAVGFIPQRRGERGEVVRIMDLAERHARELKPKTEAEELLYVENLHPVLESRAKEALWLGDLDLAVERARAVVELDRYDSKTWIELGEVAMKRQEWARAAEAYVTAAMLGPPASAVGRYMAGVCYRQLGQETVAAFFFKDALETDPLGISPRNALSQLPDTVVLDALKEWNLSTVSL